MKTSLKDFKAEIQSALIAFLWRQWSALGVSGNVRQKEDRIVDPEALLLFTCTIGRNDPRLFDEVLDWLQKNGRLLNVARLKRILRTEGFAGERVLAAVAGLFAKGEAEVKWRQLASLGVARPEAQSLFLRENGKPLPVVGEPEATFLRYGFKRGPLRLRGHSKEFPPGDTAPLILKLRALLGITLRCEIILYLLTHPDAHPSQIARDTYYFNRAVQATLVDMSRSGVVHVRVGKRAKHYWLDREGWLRMLNRTEKTTPDWTTWPPLLGALEKIWLRLEDQELHTLSPLLQSSELRELMATVRPSLERAGVDRVLSDETQHRGEAYLPVFISDIRGVLKAIQ